MTEPWSVGERFGMTLPLLSRLYRRDIDEVLKEYGLTKMTVLPLELLAQTKSGCRHRVLARLMSVEGPTLVRVIDQLVDAGYVERIDDQKDRRGTVIRLTASGRRFHDTMRLRLAKTRKAIFAGVSETELVSTLQILDQVLANIMDKNNQGSLVES